MNRVEQVARTTGNFLVGIGAYVLGVIVGVISVAFALVQTALTLVSTDLVSIAFGALYTWPLWNFVLRPVFPYVTEINFLQALGLVTLAHIIFRAKATYAKPRTAEERLFDSILAEAAAGRTACNDPKRGCDTGPKRPVSGASR